MERRGLMQALRFSVDNEKTVALSGAGLWVAYGGKPCTTFGKK